MADTSAIPQTNKGWVYYSSSHEEFEEILGFLKKVNYSLLWLKPEEYYFNQNELAVLLQAFSPLKCILGYTTSGGSCSSEKLNELKRAFGGWKGLYRNVFRRKDYLVQQEKYYSDLSVLTYSEIAEGEEFFSRNLFGYDSALFFAQSLDNISATFDKLVEARFIRLQENGIPTSGDRQRYVLECIDALLQNKVVVVLVIEDTECCKSLLLLSREEDYLKQANERLKASEYFHSARSNEVSCFVERGLGLTIFS
ncbi:hypothetical protein ACN4EG_15445 [Alkalinema pantanalense CENA528]|uniref:hypothetical protein n=1 Tax=Alkalinema pantanalense TaxID=1620705 RepID=UPI003D6FA49A